MFIDKLFSFIEWIEKKKCKFYKNCGQAENHTCNHGGGDYCGAFREKEEWKD